MRNKRRCIIRISLLFCILVFGCKIAEVREASNEHPNELEEIVSKYNLELPENDERIIHEIFGFKMCMHYIENKQSEKYCSILYAYAELLELVDKFDDGLYVVPMTAKAVYLLPNDEKEGKGILVYLEYYDWVEGEWCVKRDYIQ